jgi:hypothetical protein
VRDGDTESPIANATVTYEFVEGDGSLVSSVTATTDEQGVYVFNPYGAGTTIAHPERMLDRGFYRVRVQAPGYRDATYYVRHRGFPRRHRNGRLYSDRMDFELAPTNAPDQDNDGLTSRWEQRLGTSDNDRDSDGDGLTDLEEVRGASFVDLKTWLDETPADPAVHDLYLQLAYHRGALDGNVTSDASRLAVLDFVERLRSLLASAPPIERNGRSYPRRLHARISTSAHVTACVDYNVRTTNYVTCAEVSEDQPICAPHEARRIACSLKADPNVQFQCSTPRSVRARIMPQQVRGQSDEWRITHFGIVTQRMAHEYWGWGDPFDRFFLATVNAVEYPEDATREKLVSTMMHEFGHALGLGHNNHYSQRSDFHRSVMNYEFDKHPSLTGREAVPCDSDAFCPTGFACRVPSFASTRRCVYQPQWSLGGGSANTRCGQGQNACPTGYTCRTPPWSQVARCVRNGTSPRTITRIADPAYESQGWQYQGYCLDPSRYTESRGISFPGGKPCQQASSCRIVAGAISISGQCSSLKCQYTVAELGRLRAQVASATAAVALINSIGNTITLADFLHADCDIDEWEFVGRNGGNLVRTSPNCP